jgi:mutator protein MutT
MKRVEVAAGLIFRGGKLLITQRRSGDHLGGLWEFPGGKREGDETFEHCLRRELREEIGVEVEVGELLQQIDHDYPEKQVSLHFFYCRILEGEPRPLACPDLRWISKEGLARFEFPAADAALVEKLKTMEWPE